MGRRYISRAEALRHFPSWTQADRISAVAALAAAEPNRMYVVPSGAYVRGVDTDHNLVCQFQARHIDFRTDLAPADAIIYERHKGRETRAKILLSDAVA